MDSVGNTYTDRQLIKIGALYSALARFLPTEGRDYGVKIGFHGDDDTMSLEMEPYTPVGKMWCDYCMGMFRNSGGVK